MITLYSKATSNGRKASILLEETGLPYVVRPMDLSAREQKQDWFLKINPNGRIPAIVDDDGPGGNPVTLFESGAILVYLAEKAGQFLPGAGEAVPESAGDGRRADVLAWLFFASTHVTFTGMQIHWLVRQRAAGQPIHYLDMWKRENERVYAIADQRLADADYLGGDDYSIADIAAYPWMARHALQEIDLPAFPHVAHWLDKVGGRPAVRRGMQVPPRDDGL